MPRAIRSTRDGTFANAALPPFGDGIATVRQAVHDGDTVNVAPDGDFAIRFLGVDTAERSFDFPLRAGEPPRENPRFVSLSAAEWETFLTDPFSSDWRPFNPPLDAALRVNLQARTGAGAAGNHDVWARAGERLLETEIERDRTERNLALADFRFFLAFAFEVMDGYGRLLCFLNVSEPDRARRPEDYNLRMLRAGLAVPYFIWPNVDPFLRASSFVQAAGGPGPLREAIASSRSLRNAREAVAAARAAREGVFSADNPLRVMPFELRFLARRTPPDRWVIDLSADDDRLHAPQSYVAIPNAEDRLFLPSEYVPLFVENGWRRA